MQKGFVNFILGSASHRLAYLNIFLGWYWASKWAGLGLLACSSGPSGPWGLQHSPEILTQKAKEVHPKALLASCSEASNRLFSLFETAVTCDSPTVKKLVSCASHVTPWGTGQRVFGSWLVNPDTRRVPVERILSQAIYAAIKNKEITSHTAGKSLDNSNHSGSSTVFTSKAIADETETSIIKSQLWSYSNPSAIKLK